MNVEQEILRAAEAQEECVHIMQRCSTFADIRDGFLRVVEIMKKDQDRKI